MDTSALIQEIERLPLPQKFLIIETTLQSIKRHEMAHERASAFQEAFGAWDASETAEELIETIKNGRMTNRRIEEI
jgi:hypothetical protein